MRKLLGALHRWLGLFMAVFLFVSGVTGALIAWEHELDAALNPSMYRANWSHPIDPLTLANQLEASDPRLRVSYLPLQHEPGHALNLFVDARDAEAQKTLTFDQLALDPDTGAIQARRLWGAISIAPENLMPFLYKLHYSLHLPTVDAVETGVLLLGIVGMVWVLDCFVALAIAFPSRRRWYRSLTFRLGNGWPKLNFDLHRSGGVWLWLLLLMIAVTSVSMNLGFQVVRPIVNSFSPLTPSPFETQTFAPYSTPAVTREQVLTQAREQARTENIPQPPGGLFYSAEFNVFGVGFFEAGNSHGDDGLGNPWFYFNGADGDYLGATIPGRGSAGDIFMQAQFPLHSGRILGLWGRVLMSFLGIFVAALSVTGVIIWARKRRARIQAAPRKREGVFRGDRSVGIFVDKAADQGQENDFEVKPE